MWIKFCDQQPAQETKRYLVAIKRQSTWGKKVIWKQQVFGWRSYLAGGGRMKYKFDTGNIPSKDIIYWRELPENPKEKKDD